MCDCVFVCVRVCVYVCARCVCDVCVVCVCECMCVCVFYFILIHNKIQKKCVVCASLMFAHTLRTYTHMHTHTHTFCTLKK